MRWLFSSVTLCVLMVLFSPVLYGQIENVPIANQVYEFLDRMAIKGVLPLYSNVMIPISRQEVADFLKSVDGQREKLTGSEIQFLDKFMQEFIHEIKPAEENSAVLFRDGFDGMFSDKEKYLYAYNDSVVSLYMEFLGALEYRGITGDTYGSTHAGFEQHGGRFRGTLKNHLGYYLEGTDGTFYGDKVFALSDPRLRGNVKFNDLNTPYFDFTQAYLRANAEWFNVEFGREYTVVGTGYSDRLILSDNAALFDFLKLDFHYKTIRYEFMHASILPDSAPAPGLIQSAPPNSNKYLSLHRLQFSLFDRLNLGVSEMTVYQRYSIEFAYLNPIIFMKSVEHSLHDRDNSFLNFDFELFPTNGYKLYGTWLIDDIDFSKLGTGWWGNEFGLQGGAYAAEFLGLHNFDADVEYTKIDPYVYSNRTENDNYTHNNASLGHHLPPNSDEWFVQFGYRPAKSVRTWLAWYGTRHGHNLYDAAGKLERNVGGNVLEGHRDVDSDDVTFLDGNLVKMEKIQLRTTIEPITNFFISGTYEFRYSDYVNQGYTATDHYFAIRTWVEY